MLRWLAGTLPRGSLLCAHCQQRTAGFWVFMAGHKTVARPWCLACQDDLPVGAMAVPLER